MYVRKCNRWSEAEELEMGGKVAGSLIDFLAAASDVGQCRGKEPGRTTLQDPPHGHTTMLRQDTTGRGGGR
jgi:hypothetical protein